MTWSHLTRHLLMATGISIQNINLVTSNVGASTLVYGYLSEMYGFEKEIVQCERGFFKIWLVRPIFFLTFYSAEGHLFLRSITMTNFTHSIRSR